MATETCESCGRSVPVGGGVANLWTLERDETGGVTVELADDTEHFLCFACTRRLPDDPTTADVEAIDAAAVRAAVEGSAEGATDGEGEADGEGVSSRADATATRSDDEGLHEEPVDDGGIRFVGYGLALGAVLGIALGATFEDTGLWLSMGIGLGFAIGLLVGRIVEIREKRK